MSETIVSPSRLSYSREFLLQYSNNVKSEPSIVEKLLPYLSPPHSSKTKKNVLTSRPFGKKNWNTNNNNESSSEKQQKSKTPNPRKPLASVLPNQQQVQTEKKTFGQRDNVFSPTQFKTKSVVPRESDKENTLPSNNGLNGNSGKFLSPFKALENALTPGAAGPRKNNNSNTPVVASARNRITIATPTRGNTITGGIPKQQSLQIVKKPEAVDTSANQSAISVQIVVSKSSTLPTVGVPVSVQDCAALQTPVKTPIQYKSPVHPPKDANANPCSSSPPNANTKESNTPKCRLNPTPAGVGPVNTPATTQTTPYKSPGSTGAIASPGKSPKSPNRPISPLDEQRLLQRQKQIDYGYRTVGYLRYRLLVTKEQRKPEHPRTPKKTQGCSKRSWDGQLKKWRRDLHLWDPDNMDAFRALLNSDLVVSIITANSELEEIVRIVRDKMDNPSAVPDTEDDLTSPGALESDSLISKPDLEDIRKTSLSAECKTAPDGVKENKVSPARIANEPQLQKVARTLFF